MKSSDVGQILDRLRTIDEARKSFDVKPQWVTTQNRSTQRLTLNVALRLDGILRGGVSILLATPVDAWEEDVYGHIAVRLPGLSRSLRLNPVEWSPLRHHDNPLSGPAAHRGVRLFDRWHPFDINAQFGLASFDQSGPGIAVELPRVPNRFSEFSDLCSNLWRCPDMMGLPPPPWSRRLV